MIRLVLDTSAIRAYAAGSLHVGEPISEVGDEGGEVAVPVVCLATAAPETDDHMLSLLVQHRATILVPTLADDWRFVVRNVRRFGRVDLAVAMLLATDHSAYILTAEPDAYGDPGAPVVIAIPPD